MFWNDVTNLTALIVWWSAQCTVFYYSCILKVSTNHTAFVFFSARLLVLFYWHIWNFSMSVNTPVEFLSTQS